MSSIICLESVDVLKKTLHHQWADESEMRNAVDSLLDRIAEFAPVEIEEAAADDPAAAERSTAAPRRTGSPRQQSAAPLAARRPCPSQNPSASRSNASTA